MQLIYLRLKTDSCASRPHPHCLCVLLWVLWMENMWATTFPPEKAAFLPNHSISLTFVHLQGRASVRLPEGVGFDGSETGLESVSCDPNTSSSEGPRSQSRQGLQRLSCCTVAHVIMARLNCTSTQAQVIASSQVWMQFSITSHLFLCHNTALCLSVVF